MKKLVMQSEHWAHGLPMSAYYALMHTGGDISSRQDLHALRELNKFSRLSERMEILTAADVDPGMHKGIVSRHR